MFTLHGPRRQCRRGITRRDVLQVGALGLAGLTLPQLLRLQDSVAAEIPTRGVSEERQKSVITEHPGPVVVNADETLASPIEFNTEVGGAGIERVFQQFLDDRRRALNDFTGGNLIGNSIGKDANTAHRNFLV